MEVFTLFFVLQLITCRQDHINTGKTNRKKKQNTKTKAVRRASKEF